MDPNQQATPPLSTQTEELRSREEKIQAYLEKEIPNAKSRFCRFYRRGCCLFSAKDCKFAHGVKDFQFNKLSCDQFLNHSKSEATSKDKPREDDQDEEDQALDRKNKDKQPSLGLELTHKDLYDYQFILKEKGEVDTIYSVNDIDLTRHIRHSIRQKLSYDLQKEFVEFLYQEYNTTALKRSFIEHCFLRIDWMAHWKQIMDKICLYEVKSPQGVLMVKQLVGEAFNKYMEDAVIRIIKDYKLLDNLPISPAYITKLYYQHQRTLDPLMPSHQIYLKYRDIESMDDYLNALQSAESFRQKLAQACGKTVEEISNMTLFDHASNEMNELMTQIRVVLMDLVEKSHIGFILYSRYEDKVMKECAQRLQQFNNNLPQIKKIMMKKALQENILLVNLNSAHYLFALDKFKKANLNIIRGKYYEKLYTSCPLPSSDHIALHQMPELRPEKMDAYIPDRQSAEVLDKEIDIRKIVVVDNEETLKEAMEHFATVDAIGVDLEGNLCKNGRLELVQCGSKDKIFIFDIYNAKLKAKEDEKFAGAYKNISSFVKKIVEDSKICKIFHDGRKDSLALHLFLDACPSNVFDLSAVFMLIEHLEQYNAQRAKPSDSTEETKEGEKTVKNVKVDWAIVEEPKLPGLNDVLEKYGARHGLNSLKTVMKSRFGAVPIEYFLKRPIDKEFLIYSARDVEDLVEVKKKMEQKLRDLLKSFVGNVEGDRVDLLCKKVSKTYALHGCEHTFKEGTN